MNRIARTTMRNYAYLTREPGTAQCVAILGDARESIPRRPDCFSVEIDVAS